MAPDLTSSSARWMARASSAGVVRPRNLEAARKPGHHAWEFLSMNRESLSFWRTVWAVAFGQILAGVLLIGVSLLLFFGCAGARLCRYDAGVIGCFRYGDPREHERGGNGPETRPTHRRVWRTISPPSQPGNYSYSWSWSCKCSRPPWLRWLRVDRQPQEVSYDSATPRTTEREGSRSYSCGDVARRRNADGIQHSRPARMAFPYA